MLRPKSHQRSLSYALNTSKQWDETVAFKFYGRCKQGLLTSPGWSAPWSARGCQWAAWWWLEGQGVGGRDTSGPAGLCPEGLHAAGHIWSPRIRQGVWEQTGHRQTSTSRVSGFRGPQQGTSQACVSPIWKQIHWRRGAQGPQPDDHSTE